MCNNSIYFILFLLLICLCVLSIISKSKSQIYDLCIAATKIKNNKNISGGNDNYKKPYIGKNKFRREFSKKKQSTKRITDQTINTIPIKLKFPPERLF